MRVQAAIAVISTALVFSGCSANVRRSDSGEKNVDVQTPVGTISVKKDERSPENKSVDIKTPFGGMQVRTNDVSAKDTGLPVYPGSRLAPRSDNNDSQANVNIATAWFGLKVVALKYESDDSPGRILDYYRKEMARYGGIVECQGGRQVGGVRATAADSDELTCDDHDSKGHGPNIDLSKEHDTVELKVGSKGRQRIVAVKPSGKGAAFDLVYVQTRETKETM